MLIREWKSGDNYVIAELEKKCFSYPWSYDMVCQTQGLNNFCGVVAIIDEKVVGYAGAIFASDIADVALVAVDPEFRRQKIAERAVKTLIDALIQKKVEKIFLEVRVSNQPARGLYTKLGFEEIGIRKNYYEDAEDAIVMALVIKSEYSKKKNSFN